MQNLPIESVSPSRTVTFRFQSEDLLIWNAEGTANLPLSFRLRLPLSEHFSNYLIRLIDKSSYTAFESSFSCIRSQTANIRHERKTHQWKPFVRWHFLNWTKLRRGTKQRRECRFAHRLSAITQLRQQRAMDRTATAGAGLYRALPAAAPDSDRCGSVEVQGHAVRSTSPTPPHPSCASSMVLTASSQQQQQQQRRNGGVDATQIERQRLATADRLK